MLSFACESPLEITSVDLRQLLSAAVGLTRVGQNPCVQLEIKLEGEIPSVAADSSRILQVFLQIIGNGVDAVEEKGSGSLVITLLARTQSICLKVAIVTAVAQTLAAFALKESYGATVIGDIASLILTGVLLILCGLNSRSSTGPARMFWLLNTAAFTFLFSSYSYWSYSEVLLKKSAPNPLIVDGFFFLVPALMLASLAFRRHSESAASDVRFRRIHFAFLLSWWLCFYCYFVVPWLTVVNNFASYNRANYFL